jgi:HPt (histidine-containing phosphotransfer) domain-containing protein
MNASTDKMSNLDFLKNFTGNNPVKMEKYISIFLEIAPPEEELLRKSLELKDWDSVRASAHSMRPQMTYMGIKSGEQLLDTIEKNAESLTALEKMPEYIGDFNKIFKLACGELKAYLETIKS